MTTFEICSGRAGGPHAVSARRLRPGTARSSAARRSWSVTENAYFPLQFVDQKTGKPGRLGI